MNIYRLIPSDKMIERLQYENACWMTREYPSCINRCRNVCILIYSIPFLQETEIRRAVAPMGSRRVGKTVMMFHAYNMGENT